MTITVRQGDNRDKEYTIKTRKGADGKRLSLGNVKQGRYGPQMGIKVTDEFRALVNAAEKDTWLNWDLFEKDGQYQAAPQSSSSD